MTTFRAGLLLLACGLAAGCGGSDDTVEGPGPFDRLEAEFDGLNNEVQELSFTDPVSLPTSGAATYDGVIALDIGAVDNGTLQGADVMGDLSLTVNFAGAGGAVTGQADNFVGVDDASWDGTLIIDEGSLDRAADPESDATLTADLGGVLTDPDGTAWEMDADLSGDFAGDEHSHVKGGIAGAACQGGDPCTSLGGVFVGER